MNAKLSWSQQVILEMLSKNAGKVVSHRTLANELWHDRKELPSTWKRMLRDEIQGLRDAEPNVRHKIMNVHGRGYILGIEVVYS